jgi:hypothetical protein
MGNPEFITIVSGLPRSGTSLMMQMLAAGGLPIVTDAVRSPDENNPRGYFEFESVKKLRLDSSWLGQARGHAIKIIHLLLRELPTDGRVSYRVLFMERAMNEILASQRRMLERAGRHAADDLVLARMFGAQLTQAKDWIAAHPCFSSISVDHRRLIEQPSVAAREVARFLGLELDTEKMAAAMDPALYRERQV